MRFIRRLNQYYFMQRMKVSGSKTEVVKVHSSRWCREVKEWVETSVTEAASLTCFILFSKINTDHLASLGLCKKVNRLNWLVHSCWVSSTLQLTSTQKTNTLLRVAESSFSCFPTLLCSRQHQACFHGIAVHTSRILVNNMLNC